MPAGEGNDLEFHRRIVACSGHSVLTPLLDSLAEHQAILDALAGHEPEVARPRATVPIAGVEQWLASAP